MYSVLKIEGKLPQELPVPASKMNLTHVIIKCSFKPSNNNNKTKPVIDSEGSGVSEDGRMGVFQNGQKRVTCSWESIRRRVGLGCIKERKQAFLCGRGSSRSADVETGTGTAV